LVVAGDAVEGEPCPADAADTARHILRRDRGMGGQVGTGGDRSGTCKGRSPAAMSCSVPSGPVGAGFAKQQTAPQHSQRPLARV
jgi:hypothetical protein